MARSDRESSQLGRQATCRHWLFIGLLASSLACRNESAVEAEGTKAKASARASDGKEVRLEKVTERPMDQTLRVSGTLAADEQVTLAVKAAGRLTSISVDMASPVQRGQAIAQVDTTDYQLRVEQAQAAVAQLRAQLGLDPSAADNAIDVENTAIVRQARATLEEAKQNLNRARTLSQEGAMSAMEREAAEAAAVRAETALQSAREEVRVREATLRQRRSELTMAKQQLADTIIRSPLDGVIQMRRGNVGEYFAAGAPIAEVVRIDPLRLRVAIPEREAQSVKTGLLVRISIDGDPTTYSGTIARLAPALDQQSRSLLVEADIKNPGNLRPGSFVHAQIVVGTKPVRTVPATAIVKFAGIEKVITVEHGKAVEKRVTTGKTFGDRTEIVSGVELGQSVVVRPGSLQRGQPVRVIAGS